MAGDGAAGARTRYGIIAVGIGVIALIAGIVVAGLPSDVPNDIDVAEIQPPPATTTTTISTIAEESVAPTGPPAITQASTEVPATTDPADPTSTTVRRATTTTSSTSTTQPSFPRPAAEVRVVVANGGGADGLAGRTADEIRGHGYVNVVATNTAARQGTSVVYYAAGNHLEAVQLASLLDIPAVEPQPTGAITLSGEPSDVWVVLGGDRI